MGNVCSSEALPSSYSTSSARRQLRLQRKSVYFTLSLTHHQEGIIVFLSRQDRFQSSLLLEVQIGSLPNPLPFSGVIVASPAARLYRRAERLPLSGVIVASPAARLYRRGERRQRGTTGKTSPRIGIEGIDRDLVFTVFHTLDNCLNPLTGTYMTSL